MNWLALIPLFLKYGPILEQLWAIATSNEDYISKVEQLLPSVAKYAVEIANQFFPGQAAVVSAVASTALVFNTKLVMYAQQACNLVLDSKLEVDGMYGPKTKAAVIALQKHLGLTADGIFGKITEAAIKKLNLPGLS